jgi:hypothetical protein
LLKIRSLNNKGCIVNAINAADMIPMIDTIEIEYKAGCLANTSTPIPNMVVRTDKITEVL